MLSAKFSIGQIVDARMIPRAALTGAYEIVVRLPGSGGDNQYWVKSLQTGDLRVARQSELAVQLAKEQLRTS